MYRWLKKLFGERLLSPVVVFDPFPSPASFATHGQEPVVPPLAHTNVFDGVPELLPLALVREKPPVIVLAKQVIRPCLSLVGASRNRLAMRERRTPQAHDKQDRNRSHVCRGGICERWYGLGRCSLRERARQRLHARGC